MDGVDGGFHWDARMDRSDASLDCASSRWETVAHGDVFNECRVDARLCVGGAEDMCEKKLGFGVFETAFPALGVKDG